MEKGSNYWNQRNYNKQRNYIYAHTAQTHTLDYFEELYSNKLEKLDNYILPNLLHLYTNHRPISAGKKHWNYSRN